MINNRFRAPKGDKIILRMFVIPKSDQQANPENGARDLNDRKLNVDEARTGVTKFMTREVKMTGWLMSGLKRFNAFLLYEEVRHYSEL